MLVCGEYNPTTTHLADSLGTRFCAESTRMARVGTCSSLRVDRGSYGGGRRSCGSDERGRDE